MACVHACSSRQTVDENDFWLCVDGCNCDQLAPGTCVCLSVCLILSSISVSAYICAFHLLDAVVGD